MARARLPFGRSKAPVLDELGGTPDGALAIVVDDHRFHLTSRRVAAALRYFVARAEAPGASGLPGCVAVTSALRGEGVSYVSRSLAAVLAYDGDTSVALVDLNWKAPPHATKKKRRGRKGDPRPAATDKATTAKASIDAGDTGLADGASSESDRPLTLVDAVEGNATLDEIVQPTSNPRLAVIAPGAVLQTRRPAMARSRELEKVMQQITGRFDHVLLDLPSVHASSDAVSLAQLADAFILVVRHGITTTSQVDSALEELSGIQSLGVILNRFDSRVPGLLRKMVGA